MVLWLAPARHNLQITRLVLVEILRSVMVPSIRYKERDTTPQPAAPQHHHGDTNTEKLQRGDNLSPCSLDLSLSLSLSLGWPCQLGPQRWSWRPSRQLIVLRGTDGSLRSSETPSIKKIRMGVKACYDRLSLSLHAHL